MKESFANNRRRTAEGRQARVQSQGRSKKKNIDERRSLRIASEAAQQLSITK
jgi:hypothetical protein